MFYFFFNLTYSRWTSSLPSCLWSLRIFPSLPGSRLTIFYRDASSALLQLVNMVEFYLLTFPRFPLRKKEHKSYFGKNRTHDFRITSRCADYLLARATTAACMYVCMVITYSRVWINRVRSLVVSWTGKMNISLSPCVPENLVSRDGFSRPVPRQSAHLHTQANKC